jgi:hypothetical protein
VAGADPSSIYDLAEEIAKEPQRYESRWVTRFAVFVATTVVIFRLSLSPLWPYGFSVRLESVRGVRWSIKDS